MIGSRIEEVNPELKYMGKTYQDQPIEVRGINPILNYRKANEMGMVGAQEGCRAAQNTDRICSRDAPAKEKLRCKRPG